MDDSPAMIRRLPVGAESVSHTNAFGFLRILFAVMVLLDHCSQLLYQDDYAEVLYRITSNRVSFGQLAVAGFFIVSGYLITQSYVKSDSTWRYLYKRILRICPGFCVSFLICVFIVGPTFGGKIAELNYIDYFKMLGRLIRLEPPYLDGSFSTIGGRSLNGSMWSIAYEARCYLLVPLLGGLNLLEKRSLMLTVTFLLVIANLPVFSQFLPNVPVAIPDARDFVLCTSMFFTGATFYLWRDSIPLNGKCAVPCLLLLVASFFSDWFRSIAIQPLLSYLIFYVALKQKSDWFNKINNKTDISYGVYIYAWPITLCIIAIVPGISIFSLTALTLAISLAAGFASWQLVEKPALTFKRREALLDPKDARDDALSGEAVYQVLPAVLSRRETP